MQVIGTTTPQEVWVLDQTRPFRTNELLIIEDPQLGLLTGEVVECQSHHPLLSGSKGEGAVLDRQLLSNLLTIGLDPRREVVHLARVRLLTEARWPVAFAAPVRLPRFEEVAPLLLKTGPDTGLTLGVIAGTEELGQELPAGLREIAPLWNGEGLQAQEGVPFIFNYQAMNQYPHLGIFGGSGSGKSFGTRVVLEELMQQGIPTIVLDPHWEMSFEQQVAGWPPGLQREWTRRAVLFAIGQEVGVNFSELNGAEVANLLAAAGGSLSEAMENAVITLHQRRDSLQTFKTRLEELRWALENESKLRKSPDLFTPEKVRQAQELLEEYKDRISGPGTLAGIQWRLNRLEQTGIFHRDIRPVEEELIKRKLVIIRGTVTTLNIFAAYVLKKFYDKRRQYRDSLQRGERSGEPFPPFVIVADEAHNFAPVSPVIPAPARSILKEIAQEGRKYGVFLILATQRPALLDETINAQLNTKFIFRTTRSQDIDLIQRESDLSREETRRLPYLPSGTCFVSSAIYGRSLLVRIRAAKTASPHSHNPFTELSRDFASEEDKMSEILLGLLPLNEASLLSYLPEIGQRLGRAVTIEEVKAALADLACQGRCREISTPFGKKYEVMP
ncbi:MAG: ATP-binding protein [Bacillota bacterium]